MALGAKNPLKTRLESVANGRDFLDTREMPELGG